ncbi:MAG: HEAT repeat domain-containing protein [Nitrospirae bacterium]|nr:HEAT repeat domain-containing protein [Nitrospirota bacterium]
MSNNGMEEMTKMVADYMEGGFLDNIIAMFRKDKSLYGIVGDILADERQRVRIGIIALVETMKYEDYPNLLASIPGVAAQLRNQNPTIRGDAAYLLGIIGHKDALPYLSNAAEDKHKLVKEIIDESIRGIKQHSLSHRIITSE